MGLLLHTVEGLFNIHQYKFLLIWCLIFVSNMTLLLDFSIMP